MTTTTATQTSLSTSTTPIVTRSRLAAAAYWITTALAALAFLSGGAIDIGQPANMVALMAHLGYPAFLLTLLGVWKILGGVAILAPRLPRLKEWAYAGMFFDLTGAAVSHAATGDAANHVATPLVILALVLASWALRPAGRKLAAAPAAGAYFSFLRS